MRCHGNVLSKFLLAGLAVVSHVSTFHHVSEFYLNIIKKIDINCLQVDKLGHVSYSVNSKLSNEDLI